MKKIINGYDIDKELQSFFELPLGDNLTLSIYDSEEGYEIEVIEGIDEQNNYIDCIIYQTNKWEKLRSLILYAINNTYSNNIKNKIIKELKEN